MSKEERINPITSHVIDGYGGYLTIKVATQMHGFCGFLSENLVIKLKRFQVLTFSILNYHRPNSLYSVYTSLLETTLAFFL